MAQGPFTETEGAAFNPDILSQLVIRYRMPKLIAEKVADRRYEAVKLGDNIDVVPVARPTVATMALAPGFKTTTYWSETPTKVTININKWSYAALAFDFYETCVQAMDLETLYRQGAIDTVLVKIDADTLAELDTYTATAGSDAATMSDDNVLTAVDALDVANVPNEDRAFIMYPTVKNEFLKLDKWTNAQYRGGQTPINDRNFGSIYGLNLFDTTNVKAGSSGHVNGIIHREALALVIRKGVGTAWVLDDPDTQSRKIVFPAVYGIKVMRQDHGYELLGK